MKSNDPFGFKAVEEALENVRKEYAYWQCPKCGYANRISGHTSVKPSSGEVRICGSCRARLFYN